MIICVACKYVHHHLDRVEKKGIKYTMCPMCWCGGFIKKK